MTHQTLAGPAAPHDPTDCSTMAEVRDAIDAIDRALVALLGQRMRFIEAAARIKPSRDMVRDEWRKADVLAKVQAAAAVQEFPPALAAAMFELLVEGSIAHEFERFDRRASQQQPAG